jgi:hypothetical protein
MPHHSTIPKYQHGRFRQSKMRNIRRRFHDPGAIKQHGLDASRVPRVLSCGEQ